MRIAVAALCVLALTGSAIAIDAPPPLPPGNDGRPCHVEYIPLDKRQEPIVPYRVSYVRSWNGLQKDCLMYDGTEATLVWGCFVANSTRTAANIYIYAGLADDMRACVLLHEKAHLPPNNWQHPGPTTPHTSPLSH